MVVLGTFGTEKVIFPYRMEGFGIFTFGHIWLLVKCSILTKIPLSGPEKVNLQKIKNFSGQNRTKIELYGNNKV
jgi:hypothetical protein